MLGCCSSFSREISLIAVDGIPSSSLSRRIFFIATICPVILFRPLYTTPYVPVSEQSKWKYKQDKNAINHQQLKRDQQRRGKITSITFSNFLYLHVIGQPTGSLSGFFTHSEMCKCWVNNSKFNWPRKEGVVGFDSEGKNHFSLILDSILVQKPRKTV